MKIQGGSASAEGQLVLYSNNYIVAVSLNEKRDIIVSHQKHNLNSKNIIGKIPFVRGVYVNTKQSLDQIGYIVFALILYILDKLIFKIHLMDYVYFAYILILSCSTKFSNMSNLHGAEHAITNYYNKHHTIENIQEDILKKESRIHDRCGTTLIIYNLIFIYGMLFITRDFLIRFLVSMALSYEIVIIKENNVLIRTILLPFKLISRFIQKYVFVSEPRDIDIKMAIKAVEKLEELEG